MKLKNFIRKVNNKFFENKVNKKAAYILFRILTQGLKEKGYVANASIIEFKHISFLNEKSDHLKLYRESLAFSEGIETDNIYKIFRNLNLYSIIENILEKQIAGDFAECGCWHGCSLYATNFLIQKYKSKKKIHVFDSFEKGLSDFQKEDSEESIVKPNEFNNLKKMYYSSFEKLKNKFNKNTNIFLNKGWIPEILNSEKDRKYCFVNIDVDMYQPTLDCFNYFFDRLEKGGIIYCDDYGSSTFPGAKKAVDEFIGNLDKRKYTDKFIFSVSGFMLIK